MTAKYVSVLDACHVSHVRLILPLTMSLYNHVNSIRVHVQCTGYIPKVSCIVSACAPWTYQLSVFAYTYSLESSCRWLLVPQPQSLSWMMGVQEQRLAGEGLAWKSCTSSATYLIHIDQPFNHNSAKALVTIFQSIWLKVVIELHLMRRLQVLFLWFSILWKHGCKIVVIGPF